MGGGETGRIILDYLGFSLTVLSLSLIVGMNKVCFIKLACLCHFASRSLGLFLESNTKQEKQI